MTLNPLAVADHVFERGRTGFGYCTQRFFDDIGQAAFLVAR
jgi:hypothetical protein